jgi:predicted O-methyltransferase YrrM
VTLAEIVCKMRHCASDNVWINRIRFLKPHNVVELGTGQGATASYIMIALHDNAIFTTFNYSYPANQRFGEYLHSWLRDPRLWWITADTLDPASLQYVPNDIDLLFIDTTHEAWHAAAELRLWQVKLQDSAIVIVDDLDQNDMTAFWNSLPYDKVVDGNQGIFCYDTSRQYLAQFNKPSRTTYGGRG